MINAFSMMPEAKKAGKGLSFPGFEVVYLQSFTCGGDT
jgi:hypothetical protein